MTTERLRLLLVEADEREVAAVQSTLHQRGLGYPLHVVASGEQALAALRSGQVPRERLLILISLGPLADLKPLQVLRADPELAFLPVVVLDPTSGPTPGPASGSAPGPSTKLLCYQLHAAGYLHTPADPAAREEQLAALCNYWAANEMP